jgi:hypothetical protein
LIFDAFISPIIEFIGGEPTISLKSLKFAESGHIDAKNGMSDTLNDAVMLSGEEI